MKLLSIYVINLLFISIFSLQSPPTPTYDLTITIENIEEIKGAIRMCVVGNDETKYLKDCDFYKIVKVEDHSLSITFDGIEQGIYCISVYHDINENEELDRKGIFGMPSEPYGFSNNPRSMFGPPDFDKCTFELSENRSIQIEL